MSLGYYRLKASCVNKNVCLFMLFAMAFLVFPKWLSSKTNKKKPSAMQSMWLQSLGQEDPLEKGMATHSSILAWRIPWTEETDGEQSMGLQGVGQTEVTEHKQDGIFFCRVFSYSSGSQLCIVPFIVIPGSILWRNCLNVFLANHHSLFSCLFVYFFCYLQKHLSSVLRVTVPFLYSEPEIQILYDSAPTLIPP